jgi:hypothetical protein
VTGQTPDISELLDFGFYDLVWWLDRPTEPNFTDATRRLARWLGVSHQVGSDLSYWFITESGKIISKTSVEHVTRNDYLQADKKQEIENFNQTLETSLGDANFIIDGEGKFDSLYLQDIKDDYNSGVRHDDDTTPPQADYGDMNTEERPKDDDEEAVDKYLNVELIMNTGTSDERHGRVIKRLRGLDDNPSVGHTQTHYLIQESMKLSLQTEPVRSIRQTLSPKTCLHKLTMKITNFFFSKRSRTIKVTIAQSPFPKG